MLYETIRQRQVLEMLQRMLSPFRFPVALTIKTMGCDGLVNSWFKLRHVNSDGPSVL